MNIVICTGFGNWICNRRCLYEICTISHTKAVYTMREDGDIQVVIQKGLASRHVPVPHPPFPILLNRMDVVRWSRKSACESTRTTLKSCFYQLFRLFPILKRRVKNLRFAHFGPAKI